MNTTEVIVFEGRRYRRYPESKRRSHRVYFQCHDSNTKPIRYLHRDVWISHNGDLPEGYEVHHKDGNPLNNAIGNLEALQRKQHRAIHGKDELTEKQAAHLRVITKKAMAWHASTAGREWHRQHGVEAMQARKPVRRVCSCCGKTFKTKNLELGVRYCGSLCASRSRPPRAKRFKIKCPWCKSLFNADRQDAKFCSKSCSTKSWLHAKRASS